MSVPSSQSCENCSIHSVAIDIRITLPFTWSRYSEGSTYSVAIVATDAGSKTSSMTLTVNVMNVKAPPKFPSKKYTFTPNEGTSVGLQVILNVVERLHEISFYHETIIIRE